MTERKKRIIIGISGASGAAYARSLLEQLAGLGAETHLVVSRAGRLTAAYEMGEGFQYGPAHATYGINDVGAPIASGSFRTDGMVIAPCSVRTMSEIATGVTSTLLTRAADVCLKERRPLVLMVRETPFHLGHLRTMTQLAEMGAIIAPPLPALYAEPQTVEDIVRQSAARCLELLGFEPSETKRWGEDMGPVADDA
ncbi:UbiX family flavin prenyltransferase [Parvularcula marina]|uniref:Flavin prenyltransferase UbiX n=1 Tax=Parvularcula marina TaxID=2292771 RepID=A0A371REM0_9PROT|nr:UbiX family flavin prenyltransferase [Parvularcula marina]RFB03889.1 UbiX family flavin prenyltransferase [Parvularcula marina]